MTQNVTLPEWVNWLAQDANGSWWGFEQEPLMHDTGWYENEIGRYIRVEIENANPDWRQSLQKVK
ncbi:MAG: hypothetical protein OEY52_06550 [Gammaproteobacteria bacterium]|nr:hypothetical protein [Gammaproteobacteria bacterium]